MGCLWSQEDWIDAFKSVLAVGGSPQEPLENKVHSEDRNCRTWLKVLSYNLRTWPKKESWPLSQAIWQPQNLGQHSAHFLFFFFFFVNISLSSLQLSPGEITRLALQQPLSNRVIPWTVLCFACALRKWQELFNIYENATEKRFRHSALQGSLSTDSDFTMLKYLRNRKTKKWENHLEHLK